MIIDDKRGRCLKSVELIIPENVVNTSVSSELTKSYLNKLIVNVSDKMRSSLFVIKSYTQLLRKHDTNKEFLQRGVDRMGAASQRMEKAISELLSLINIYAQDPPPKELVYFRESYDKALFNLQTIFDNKSKVKIETDFSELTKVWFNKPYLELIFTELISNALLHNAQKKDLKIKVLSYKLVNSFVLQIEDNGIGFDMSTLKEEVKDPFNVQSPLAECIGTGLSKVEAVAKVSKSVFDIESLPDQGTICRFYFR